MCVKQYTYSETDNSELVIGVMPDVIAIGKDISKGQFEIKCTCELYNSILVNKILFNCQSWSHLKETELKDPNSKTECHAQPRRQVHISSLEFYDYIYNDTYQKEKTGLLTSYLELRILRLYL